jgi:hypothetical protein
MTESKVTDRVNNIFKPYGEGLFRYRPVPSVYGARSIDYLGMVGGHGFGIEAKRVGRLPTDKQLEHLASIRNAGGATFFVDGQEHLFRELSEWVAWAIANPATPDPFTNVPWRPIKIIGVD